MSVVFPTPLGPTSPVIRFSQFISSCIYRKNELFVSLSSFRKRANNFSICEVFCKYRLFALKECVFCIKMHYGSASCVTASAWPLYNPKKAVPSPSKRTPKRWKAPLSRLVYRRRKIVIGCSSALVNRSAIALQVLRFAQCNNVTIQQCNNAQMQ